MKPPRYTEWSPPAGLVLQPGALLVPGRVGYVGYSGSRRYTAIVCRDSQVIAETVEPGEPEGTSSPYDSSLVTRPVSVPHWDLSGLTGDELSGLLFAVGAEATRRLGVAIGAAQEVEP